MIGTGPRPRALVRARGLAGVPGRCSAGSRPRCEEDPALLVRLGGGLVLVLGRVAGRLTTRSGELDVRRRDWPGVGDDHEHGTGPFRLPCGWFLFRMGVRGSRTIG